ncbi:hypothetical protein A361_06430 [Cytobacillus oceanisediminis 2691]|uniref:Uncharacterized protein n=1 Tax=Cytobacillus oceanisediminis 2691 TaxID=1196031 RepID=A0A160M858_9BACI|nr:hypothetical protein A361_06430 [Cytobacillus oceanisediminis 2691]
MSIARPNATAFGRKYVTKTLPQDKKSDGSDTSHDRKRSFWEDVAFLVFVLLSGLYGQWTPTYPLSIPLSLEEGGLLPLRLR